jgi:hypothetical protein
MEIDRYSTTAEVKAWVKENQIQAVSYSVGAWVWLEFAEKPAEEIRKKIGLAGFHWNNNRRVWQHPCGEFSRKSKFDPRLTYEVEKI